MSNATSRPTVLVIDDSPTILKVVQLVLTKAGFTVRTAQDGEAGLAEAREAKPDLILLDFVMPKMNGYQVCREFAADPELKSVPVVLMSAKGDQVGERFVKVMGIVDYITKPFSPEAITAVVSHSIAKYTGGDLEDVAPLLPADDDSIAEITAPGFGAEPANDSVSTSSASSETDPTGSDEKAEAGALSSLAAISEAISARVLTSLADEDGNPSADSERVKDAITTAVSETLAERSTSDALIESLGNIHNINSKGDHPAPSLRGDLRVVPIAEVLQLLDAQKQDGTLVVSQGRLKSEASRSVEAYFRRGHIEMARANGVPDEFLLGRFIVDQELLSAADLSEFLESRPQASAGSSGWIGAQLVKLGYLSDAELKGALRQQTSELIYEILRWSHGSFHFERTRSLPDLALDAQLNLDVEGILMEGFRRVDEWHLIEREVDDFDMVFLRNEDMVAQMGRGRLTREELAVLELVNGKNTVKEIVRASRMGSFEVSKMLFRLLSIKLIRRRVMPVAV